MNSRYRMTVFLGIVSLLLIGGVGCGEKRLHVATTTGNPGPSEEQGNGQESIQPEQVGLGSHAGLSEEKLGREGEVEQKLSGEAPGKITLIPTLPPAGKLSQEPVGEEEEQRSASANSEPSPASQTQTVRQVAEAPGTSGGEPVPFAHEPSFPPGGQVAEVPGTSGGEPVPFAHEPSYPQAGTVESGKAAFQEQAQPPSGSFKSERLPVEPIPEKITVAKVEPTAIPKQQLEKIQIKELAETAKELQDVFFAFDRWTLEPEGRQALEKNANRLKAEPLAHLLIEGHCDERGTQAYNMALGKRRAGVIHDYLVDLGVNPSRLTVVSYGKDRPFCIDPTEVCYQLNRRGHMVVQKPK